MCATEILHRDNDIDSVPLQLDGGGPPCRPAAEHQGVADINRQSQAISFDRSLSRAGGMTFWHINICQRIKHGPAERISHRISSGSFLWIFVDDPCMLR
jgi:hypothetical protein